MKYNIFDKNPNLLYLCEFSSEYLNDHFVKILDHTDYIYKVVCPNASESVLSACHFFKKS